MRFLGSTLRLALRDLWHERVLTACLLLSVSAILAPLLLLFGLKNGIIDTMRERLLMDPSSREIYPRVGRIKPFPDEWFSLTMERPDVEFVVPRLDVAGDLKIRFSDASGERDSFQAICEVAAPGDPRLPLLGFEAPEEGRVALTRSLADKLGVEVGGNVLALVDRGGSSDPLETVTANLVVSAVVVEEVPADRAWFPLSFLVGVRDFRDFVAVPEFGWPGSDDEVEPRYDALLTLGNRFLERKELMETAMKPPGLEARVIDLDELIGLTGLVAKDASPPQAIVWRAVENLIPQRSVRDLRNRLAEIGVKAVVLPLIDPVPVAIKASDGVIHPLEMVIVEEAGDSRNTPSPEAGEIRRAFTSGWNDGLFPAISTTPPGPLAEEREQLPQASSDRHRVSYDLVLTGAAVLPGARGEPSPDLDAVEITGSAADSPEAERRPEERASASGGNPEVPVGVIRAEPVETVGEEEESEELRQEDGAREMLESPAPNRADPVQVPDSAEECSAESSSVGADSPRKQPETVGRDDRGSLSEANAATITVSDSSALPEGEARLVIEGIAGRMDVPVKVRKQAGIPESVAIVDALRGGQIRRALREPVLYREGLGVFQRKRDKFRDFRLFAATLEDVAPLAREFEAMGIPVHHASDRIAQILRLEANLSRLFWIIASAAAGAGFFGLVASFFAAVERKRKDLGVLQLLGMPKFYLFALPMLQSVVLSFAAYWLAFFLFKTFADVINAQFASDLREGETFCSLRRDHALTVMKATMGFGLIASLFAALRSSRIQPSEALRSE